MKETMDNDNRMKEGMIDRSNMKFENEYARPSYEKCKTYG